MVLQVEGRPGTDGHAGYDYFNASSYQGDTIAVVASEDAEGEAGRWITVRLNAACLAGRTLACVTYSCLLPSELMPGMAHRQSFSFVPHTSFAEASVSIS